MAWKHFSVPSRSKCPTGKKTTQFLAAMISVWTSTWKPELWKKGVVMVWVP